MVQIFYRARDKGTRKQLMLQVTLRNSKKQGKIVRPACFVFERARAPRHLLLDKGHPI